MMECMARASSIQSKHYTKVAIIYPSPTSSSVINFDSNFNFMMIIPMTQALIMTFYYSTMTSNSSIVVAEVALECNMLFGSLALRLARLLLWGTMAPVTWI